MRILVTGASGFAGRHVVRELRDHDHEVLAVDRQFEPPLPAGTSTHVCDICDGATLNAFVASTAPDACIHLAGIAFVPEGRQHPARVFRTNTMGTLHLLQAFRRLQRPAPLLTVSTAHVYGRTARSQPITESDPLQPETAYAISKCAADMLTLHYATEYGMHTMTARPHNHIGPGQSQRFVIASFAAQLRAMQCGATAPRITVGNLQSERDFTDVRDVARAYRLLVEHGRPGQAYNIASGHPVTVQSVLDALCRIAGIHPEIVVDSERFRPTDSWPPLDLTRIRQETGWTPRFHIDQTLGDILEHTPPPHAGPS